MVNILYKIMHMKKIEKTIEADKFIKYPELLTGLIHDDDIFLTIETTGLSPERHRIISVSIAEVAGEQVHITTYFSDNKDDEFAIIDASVNTIREAGRVITWNGDSFDLRFLSERGGEYDIRIKDLHSYDLRRILSPLKRFTISDSFSLYELMDEMQISDSSEADGKTLVALFKTYISTSEERYSDPVISHSIYKIKGIINLLTLQNCLKFNKAKIDITTITSTEEAISVTGHTDIFAPIHLINKRAGVTLDFYRNDFTAEFVLFNGAIRVYYPDPASYVRLKADGSLIPKELSGSLLKSEYEPVTKENCYSLNSLPSDNDRQKKQLKNYILQLLKM